MSNFFGKFFSTSNEINENTVIGLILLLATLTAIFVKPLQIPSEAVYTLAGMTMACFGFSIGKNIKKL